MMGKGKRQFSYNTRIIMIDLSKQNTLQTVAKRPSSNAKLSYCKVYFIRDASRAKLQSSNQSESVSDMKFVNGLINRRLL